MKTRTLIMTKAIIGILAVFLTENIARANNLGDLVRVQNLSGAWKFSIGERENWLAPNYNDDSWESIKVPSPWEEQGFYGYNGYGTYRKEFTVPSDMKGKSLYLQLGYVDDVDETFINGKKIGSTGTFPPNYQSAYNANRLYSIPEDYINYGGKNVIVVVVYDSYQVGGIVSGDVGLYTDRFAMSLDRNLQGPWKFRIGDDLNRRLPAFDDSNWDKIIVPGKWEDQGYRDYDGYAWYRKEFYYGGDFTGNYIILVLGKIDDVDQLYINGVLVASTGNFPNGTGRAISTGQEWLAFRGYYIPLSLLKKGQKNLIAVRVYDSGGGGGIYEGPVGFISQDKYSSYWRQRKNSGEF